MSKQGSTKARSSKRSAWPPVDLFSNAVMIGNYCSFWGAEPPSLPTLSLYNSELSSQNSIQVESLKETKKGEFLIPKCFRKSHSSKVRIQKQHIHELFTSKVLNWLTDTSKERKPCSKIFIHITQVRGVRI